MADIFISYSSYNREKASSLVKELRSAGHDVWMDQGGIGGAMDWSSEIVEALNKAKTVLFLISKDSVTSYNCAKEIHLANEKHKNILPIVLEDTPLPVLFEYPLAGLQRVPYERLDAILQALDVLKGGKSVLEAMLTHSKMDDGLIRLAVLPFEDQSPGQNNEWFASGMLDELIDTLGSLSNMKVNPKGDVVYYKNMRPRLEEIAADLKCRYLVEGSIQKAGDRIRIKTSLTDSKNHEQIWHEKYDGTFDDVFDFQEKTCFSIVQALKLKLTPDEEKKIDKKPTENADAYELYLKGKEYFLRHTKEDFTYAISLFRDAVALDPSFSVAHCHLGVASIEYYGHFERDVKWVDLARECAANAESVEGNSKHVLFLRSIIAHHLHKGDEALEYAKSVVKLDENYASGWEILGWAFQELGRLEESAYARERNLLLRENDVTAHHSYLLALNELGNIDRAKEAALKAMPVFERHLRFFRDDASTRAKYIYVLGLAQDHERAQIEAEILILDDTLDAMSLYNVACFFMNEHLPDKAMPVLRRSIEHGFHDLEWFERDPDLDGLRQRDDFKALMNEVAQILKTNG